MTRLASRGQTYGSMPNMSWIFTSSGVPVYKSDWTDARSVANAIEYVLDISERRWANGRLAPFRVERLDFRIHNQQAFFEGLKRNGPKAVREFREVFG